MNGATPATGKAALRRLGAALPAAIAAVMLSGGGIAMAAPSEETLTLMSLEDRVDGDSIVIADDEVLLDGNVALTSLTPGADYTLTATLVAPDGSPLDFGDAAPPAVTQAIHAEAPEQLASFELAFDGSPLGADADATVELALGGDGIDVTAVGTGERSVVSLVKPRVSVGFAEPGDHPVTDAALTIAVECGVDGIVADRSYDLTITLIDEAAGCPLGADAPQTVTLAATGAAPVTLSHDFTLDPAPLIGATIGVEATLSRHDRLLAEARSAPEDAIGVGASSFRSTLSDGVDGDAALTIDPQMELIERLDCQHLEPHRAYRAMSLVMDCDTASPLILGDADTAPDEAAAREFFEALIDALGLRSPELADDRATDADDADDDPSTALATPAPIDADALDGLLTRSAALLEVLSLEQIDFTPAAADETIEVVHALDASRYGPAGDPRTVTTCTLLSTGGAVVAADLDLADGRAVSLEPPTIAGALTRDEAGDPDRTELVNTVEYSGVLADAPYTLTAFLVDRDTGEDVLVDGAPVTARCDLVPSDTEGSQSMTLSFDPAETSATTLTAREELTREDVLVARGGAREGDAGIAIDDPEASPASDEGDASAGSTYAKTGLGALPWLLGIGATGGGAAALSGWHIWRRRHRW